MLTSLALLFSLSAIAVVAPAAVSAATIDPVHVTTTLEGCNNDGSTILPIGGKYICPDANYTTGNLGKGWNELDLVPFRLITDSGTQSTVTTDYNVTIAGDWINGTTGWDVISMPVVNAAKSDPSCSVTDAGTGTGALGGGADTVGFRTVLIHQPAGTTCVFDWYMRLSLGSHLFPGSSLQTYLFAGDLTSSGKKTISIPVGEALAPGLSKTMSATQPSDTTWSVSKSATPTSLSFGNVCSATAPTSLPVSVTVTWTKNAATLGSISVTTVITATNNAHRPLTFNVGDVIYSGTTSEDVYGPVSHLLAAGATSTWTHTATLANLPNLNDIATATFTDPVTAVPIPGNVTATASTTPVVTGTNGTATIQDSESITAGNYVFSVAAPASGSFPSYTAGTSTSGPVVWNSATLSASGSVSFSKTVYAPSPANVGAGTLSDTASLTGSTGFTTGSGQFDVSLSSSALGTLTINKTIPNILQGSEAVTFTFNVINAANVTVASPTIAFTAGQTSNHVDVPGLALGAYTVHEVPTTGWAILPDATITLGCTGSVSFTNSNAPATAEAIKVTVPAGSEAGWVMKLAGPGTPAGGEDATTGTNGHALFLTPLQEGAYTITETGQTGWAQVSATGECSFTVAYPANDGHNFVCTITNVQPTAAIVLTPLTATNPVGVAHVITATVSQNDQLAAGFVGPPAGDATTGSGPAPNGTLVTFSLLNNTANAAFVGGINTCTTTGGTCSVSINTNDPGSVDIHATTTFSVLGVSLTEATGSAGNSADANKIYTGGTIIIRKVTEPAGGTGFGFAATGGLLPATFSLDDGQNRTYSDVSAGTYSVSENDPTPGYDLTSINCSATTGVGTSAVGTLGTRSVAIAITGNGIVDCTFTNTKRAKVDLWKTVSGGPIPLGDSFQFSIRTGVSTTSEGTTVSSMTVDSTSGMPVHLATNLVPGSYFVCEVAPAAGWTLGVNSLPGAFEANSGLTATFCAPITLTAGQTLTLRLDNAPPPGGVALTIGYWKTHSCQAPGKQADVLDQTLALFPMNAVTGTRGFYVGLEFVDTCPKAVALLSKTPLGSTKNSASDPGYNFAAQYVAYELNLMAGAGDKPAADTAAANGQQILHDVGFLGTAKKYNYSPAQKAALLSYANTLDLFNNNKL